MEKSDKVRILSHDKKKAERRLSNRSKVVSRGCAIKPSSDENKRLLAIYLKVVPTQHPNTSMTQYKMNLIQFNLYLITHNIYENTEKGHKDTVERLIVGPC